MEGCFVVGFFGLVWGFFGGFFLVFVGLFVFFFASVTSLIPCLFHHLMSFRGSGRDLREGEGMFKGPIT